MNKNKNKNRDKNKNKNEIENCVLMRRLLAKGPMFL